jgi:hypothetical protein
MKAMAELHSCSRIPLSQLMRCLKSIRPLTSAVMSFDEHFHEQLLCPEILLPVGVLSLHSVLPCQVTYSQCSTKKCSRRNKRSVCEHTIFAPAQILRNWCEQRPSNPGDLDSSVTEKVGRVSYMAVDLLLIGVHRMLDRVSNSRYTVYIRHTKLHTVMFSSDVID